jgi:hypothetical protein
MLGLCLGSRGSSGGGGNNSSSIYRSYQTVNYGLVEDDGDKQRGRGAAWTTLDDNNPFGNTNRFTDNLGGQTYTSDEVIDWAYADYVNETVTGWYRIPLTGGTLTSYEASEPYTYAGYNDWVIPNEPELMSITAWGMIVADYYNYAPFNVDKATYPSLWMNTISAISNRYLYCQGGNGLNRATQGTSGHGCMLKREYTFTELGV